MKRILLLWLLFFAPLFVPDLVYAQQNAPALVTGTINAQASSCSPSAGSAACVFLQVNPSVSQVSITVSGTFSATLQFEWSPDGGTTWVSLSALPNGSTTAVTSTTSTGVWVANTGGASYIRVRGSAYTSGVASVTLNPSQAAAASSSSSSGGTITGVTAGTGLSGGGTSGTVTLNLSTPVSPANGGTEVINTAGQGYWLLPFGDATPALSTASTATVTAGAVRCGMINLPVSITFTKVSINVTVTSSTNHTYVAIYNAAANSLLVQATFTLTASTGALGTTVGSTTLNPGTYWECFSADNSTSVLQAVSITFNTTVLNNNTTYWGIATGVESGGTMPSSLGTITSNAAALPIVKLEP